MPAVADLRLGMAPIAGGIALGATTGYLRGPDIRRAIKQDIELLKELPPERAERRAELHRSIDTRIDDLIAATNRYRSLRRAAGTYRATFARRPCETQIKVRVCDRWRVVHDGKPYVKGDALTVRENVAQGWERSGYVERVTGKR